MTYDLDFERHLARLDDQIHKLDKRPDRLNEAQRKQRTQLHQAMDRQVRDLYASLTPWQRVLVARHVKRPHTSDYIKFMCDDFFELRGDRRFADDRAILAGLASIEGRTAMVIGHQKGRDLKEREECSYGMPHPEGFRKALRLMRQAERLHIPVFTFIDTQGAFPGIEDEERGQSQAIAENLQVMAVLRTPIVTVVIGEGGSGGALAIGVCDRLFMLQNTYFSVAAPEAASNILWRDTHHAADAAAAMQIGAPDLWERGLIDGIIAEPVGGAHQNYQAAAATVKDVLVATMAELERKPIEDLLAERYAKWRTVGEYLVEAPVVSHNSYRK
jgi:acetyl-CoA carboxylase carboxyl transferase subunit alpha